MTDQQLQNSVREEIDTSQTQLRDLARLFRILSRVDALIIFLRAKDGLVAEMRTPRELGITRKPYYTRLRQLVTAGLVARRKGAYFHTTLGSFVYENHFLSLLQLTKNAKQMKMVDALKGDGNFSDELSKIVNVLDEQAQADN